MMLRTIDSISTEAPRAHSRGALGVETIVSTTRVSTTQQIVESFEVVHVIGRGRLIDAESYERTIWGHEGGSLPPGFYVVCWSVAGLHGRYDEDAAFHGPFPRRADAWAIAQQLFTEARRPIGLLE